MGDMGGRRQQQRQLQAEAGALSQRAVDRSSQPHGLRRQLLASAVWGGLALAVQPGYAVNTALPRLVVAVSQRSPLQFLVLTVAEQLGFFADEGLEVVLQDHAVPQSALSAVVARQADVVAVGFEHLWSRAAGAESLTAFALINRTPELAVGVAMRALGQWKSTADLTRFRIGISAPETIGQRVVERMAVLNGVAGSALKWVHVGAAVSAVTAMESGQIDVLCHADPAVSLLAKRREWHVVADLRSVVDTQRVLGGLYAGACLGATTRFVRGNAVVVQHFTAAVVRALKWLQTAGAPDLVRWAPDAFGGVDRSLLLQMFEKSRDGLSPDGQFPLGGLPLIGREFNALNALPRDGRMGHVVIAPEFAARVRLRVRG
jgi:NitT/TauT family transport system substrate-binding protein